MGQLCLLYLELSGVLVLSYSFLCSVLAVSLLELVFHSQGVNCGSFVLFFCIFVLIMKFKK